MAEGVEGSKILYYIRAMVDLFTTYGNYENRAKARTRYMQDVLGDKYTEEFQKKLDAVFASGVNMDIPEEKITAENVPAAENEAGAHGKTDGVDAPMHVTKSGDAVPWKTAASLRRNRTVCTQWNIIRSEDVQIRRN